MDGTYNMYIMEYQPPIVNLWSPDVVEWTLSPRNQSSILALAGLSETGWKNRG
jgi:hypothetical protein